MLSYIFFFNATAPTEIYTLSLHDALPIFSIFAVSRAAPAPVPNDGDCRNEQREFPESESLLVEAPPGAAGLRCGCRDRKSTRLNSSHSQISYAVFCLKKKKNKTT